MENTSDFQPPNGLEPGIKIAGLVAPYQSGALPKDFPDRLERLREASELTWNDFADAAGIESTGSACTGGAGARRMASQSSQSSPTATDTTPL